MIERIPLDASVDWHAERNRYFGASEVYVACGEGGYASGAITFAEKKGLRPPKSDSGPMRKGRWAESSTLEALLEHHPDWEVKRAKVHVRDNQLRLACTPDAFATRPDKEGFGIVQLKAVSRTMFRQKWLEDPERDGDIETGAATPPTEFRLQTLTEMMLNDCSWGLLAVLITGEYVWDYREFEIKRDEAMEDRIKYCIEKFWRDYLDPGIMPPLDFERDAELVKQLYPKDAGTEIDLSGDNRALAAVEDLVLTQAAIKRMHKQESALKTELCAKLGEHSFGRLADGRRLSWRLQHRKAYAIDATDFRAFRILSPKDVEA